MPTKRFDSLPEKKKDVIRKAVLQELCRVSGGDIKISKIAEAAHISRTSFYTYFKDKEDACLMVLRQSWKKIFDMNKHILLEQEGDFWMMQQEVLRKYLIMGREHASCRFLYLSSGFVNASCNEIFGKVRMEEYQEYKQWVFRHLNPSKYQNWTEEEFGVLQDICHAVMMNSLQQYLLGDIQETEAEESFLESFRLLKRLA
ncbi:MAG: TetR/AcrR family transcriptional regulator [Brotaphodocola sp.]